MNAWQSQSLQAAEEQRRQFGFKPYDGPTLKGDRFEIPAGSELFPPALTQVRNPPSKLYCIGDPKALTEGLAVVGARRATPYGRACAEKFARIAAERGITIISGGARGCDSVAHRAALEVRTPTVVFLGGGCDQIYPASHFELFQRIIEAGGAVCSEKEWLHPALPYTFRERNRLIAGLARAVLIVEAGLPSGTFSTADEALSANRDVLVVPSAITSPTSAGSNRLLYQGAYPIVDEPSFDDALSRIFNTMRKEAAGSGNPYEDYLAKTDPSGRRVRQSDPLLKALLAEPLRMDDLFRKVGPLLPEEADARSYLQIHLAELEATKLVARYPDGRYGPCKA